MGDRKMNFEEDNQLQFETSTDVKVVASFDKMGLKEDLLRGIYAYGYYKFFQLVFSIQKWFKKSWILFEFIYFIYFQIDPWL